MKKFLLLWTNTTTVRHYNYHFTHFGEIYDYLDKKFPNEFDALDADILNYDINDVYKEILKQRYEVIVMYVTTENAYSSCSFANFIKKNNLNIKLMAYGPICFLTNKLLFNYGFDVIYKSGDFEKSIENYLNYYITKDKKFLSGIIYIENDNIIETKKGEFIDINEMGFTNLDKLPIEKYFKNPNKKRIIITISRGCPYSCPHCIIQQQEGNIDRRRNIELLKKYIKKYYNKYNYYKFFSPNFTLNKKYVVELCDMLIKDFPDIIWECTTRMNFLNDDELLRKMRDAGCKQISVGIESLTEKELITINKKNNNRKIIETIKKVNNYGIKIKACLMIGIPNQTKESIIYTFKTLRNLNVDLRPSIYSPYQNINDKMSLMEIEEFNRKLYHPNQSYIPSNKLLEIINNPNDFEMILNDD